MKYNWALLTLFTFSCCDENSVYTQKDHAVIRKEIIANYQDHQSEFQKLATTVSSFKYLRSINFRYGHFGKDGISVYCDSIDGSANDQSFVVDNLNNSRFQKALKEEGISQAAIEQIKRELEKLHCNSFYTKRQTSIYTGSPYIHIQFKYDDWNGANFYYYKLFDKKMDSQMTSSFDREKVNMGSLKGIGGLLDSNAVWFLPYD